MKSYKSKLERNIKLYYIVDFLTALLFSVPIWVAFERRVLTFTEMALFSAISSALATFLEVPTGAFADLIGRRTTMIIGWVITALSYILEAYAPNAQMFLISFLINGVGTALVSGADVALVYDSLKELNKEQDFSRFASRSKFLYRIGIALATFIGGALFAVNIRLPYFAMAIADILSVIFIVLMTEPQIDTQKFSFRQYKRQMEQGFKELLKSSYMKKLAVYYTLVGGITWSCLNYFNLPFMSSIGYTTTQLSIIFGISYIVSSLLILVLAESKNFLTRTKAYLGFPTIIVLSFIPAFFANKFFAPLILVAIQFVGSARLTFLDKYTNDEFLSEYRATALSSLNMLVTIFYILIVAVSGKVQDLYGTKIIYTVLGLLTIVLVFPSAWSLIKEHKKYKAHAVNENLLAEMHEKAI